MSIFLLPSILSHLYSAYIERFTFEGDDISMDYGTIACENVPLPASLDGALLRKFKSSRGLHVLACTKRYYRCNLPYGSTAEFTQLTHVQPWVLLRHLPLEE